MTGSLGAIFLLLAVLAGTAAGVEGPTKLSNASVSPRSGSPTTRITFAIDYRNREGSEPDHVRVLIDGRQHDMRASGTPDYKSGVRYSYRATLPAGTHRVSFAAADTRRFTASIGGGTVRITASSGSGGSGRVASPGGSGSSGSSGGGSTGGNGGTAPAGGSSQTSGGSTSGNAGAGTPSVSDPNGGDSGVGVPGPGQDLSSVGVHVVGEDVWRGGRGVPAGSSAGATAGLESSSGVDITRPGEPGTGAGVTSALPSQLLWRTGSVTWEMRALAVAIGTSGAAAVAMAFLFFGKRRRDEEQPAPDEVLEVAAATVEGFVSATQLVPPVAGQALNAGELAMPRWRRPSLLEARKTDPLRTASATYTLSFATGAVALVDGLERRKIRYRVVRLLDAPDELRGAEMGFLDQGDEVQLVERNGPFWFVRCPDGRQGWLHRMTLGDLVEDSPTAASADPTPTAPVGPATPDHDVLSSFLRREQTR
jgi:hypothetical protein